MILALDPGETTGYAYLDLVDGRPTVGEYGTIPQAGGDLAAYLLAVRQFLTNHVFYSRGVLVKETVFEDWVPMMHLPTRKEAAEVRGVIRCHCEYIRVHTHKPWASYQPRQVRAALGLPQGAKKPSVRKVVEAAVGHPLPQKQVDATDAIAVGLCHLVRSGLWTPGIVQVSPGRAKTTRKAVADEEIDLAAPGGRKRLDDLIRRGQVTFGRR